MFLSETLYLFPVPTDTSQTTMEMQCPHVMDHLTSHLGGEGGEGGGEEKFQVTPFDGKQNKLRLDGPL